MDELWISGAQVQASQKNRASELKHYLRIDNIRPMLGHGEWKRSSIGKCVKFALFGPDEVFAERLRGGRCPVVALIGEQSAWIESNKPWVSWLEEWESGGNETFRLLSASMTFFIGRASLHDKQQLLRAEWDRPDYRGPKVAQPHWHVDAHSRPSFDDMSLEAKLETEPIDLDAIYEPTAETESALDISGFHLGMGGWQHSPDCPESWQYPMKAHYITNWAIQTIAYAKSQLNRLLPTS